MKRATISLLHIGYWLIYLLLFAFLYFISHALTTTDLLFDENLGIILFFVFITGLIGFYTNYVWLAPRLLAKRKLVRYVQLGIIIAIAAGLICLFLANIGIYNLVSVIPGTKEQISLLIGFSFLALLNGILGTIIRGFIIWYSEIRVKDLLEKKNLQAELSLLKARLEPHFLFNTLNNIDILIEEDAKSASMYLQKLSDILRFMLYETTLPLIPLSKELAYLEKYIALQKIRSLNEQHIQMAVTGDADNLLIAPMLFVPFIENAFKHLPDKRIKGAIIIKIKIAEGNIDFSCENIFNSTKAVAEKQGGLGIDLSRQRLNILYKNRHQLKIQQTKNIFSVRCTITLQ